MTAFFVKQSASRLGFNKLLNYTGSGAVTTTGVSPGIYHLRILGQISGFLNIGSSAVSTGVGMLIAQNTAGGDYFQCVPGDIVTFSTTTATTGTVSVTEMS
jgi:hypothetical protein